ncbi:MAG: hypothetical protein RLP02_40645 [Coleofasciculus sp. C2-GNP5-27]
MKQKISWGKLLIEAFVIGGSILLAFGIDAWWEERSDRQEERIALSRLHGEFRNSTERLGPSTGRGNYTATIEILELLQDYQNDDSALAVPNSMIVQMLGVPTFDRVTPVLDGLIQSGNLSLIQDEDVLSSISIWQRDIIQLSEAQQDARRSTYELLIPALTIRGNLSKPLSIFPPNLQSDPTEGDSYLSVDSELLGLVANRVRHLEGISRAVERLRASTQSVIKAIEQVEDN